MITIEQAFKQISDMRDECFVDFAVEMRKDKPNLIVAYAMESKAIAFAQAAVIVGNIDLGPDCEYCEWRNSGLPPGESEEQGEGD